MYIAVLVTSVLSDDGGSIFLTFDSVSDQAGYKSRFRCSLLLSFRNDSLATCQWLTKQTLQVSLVSAVTAGTIISLKANLLRALCLSSTVGSCLPSPTQSAVLLPPLNPIKPQISLEMPQQLPSCDDLVIDATGSYGSGGKPWTQVTWTAVSGEKDMPGFFSFYSF